MKFSSINIENFRQYYGNVFIDLGTEQNKNIVLIGGRNGYGKTNFLISLVWCLYGEKISQVDENFKKEIQKEKNYSQFMKQSLNWTATNENNCSFSIQLKITDLELPEIKLFNKTITGIVIKRDFNVQTMQENLSIKDELSGDELFEDNEDKINFINDYIIPLDAAKFVFFDAEKIAAMAELSTKEEGSVLNDALGKILGLDIYEDLIGDLDLYSNNLRKEGATKNIQDQINDRENAIKINQINIDKIDENIAELIKDLTNIKFRIKEYDSFINQNSKGNAVQFDRESYLIRKELLQQKESDLEHAFNELSELIPLAILTGKLEEVSEHLLLQDQNQMLINSSSEIIGKIDTFIERLFNQAPEPVNSSMTLRDKMFYYEKAQNLSSELFEEKSEQVDLEFEHDLNNSEKSLINNAINAVNIQSKELFENTMDNYNTIKIELKEVNQTLSKIDSDLVDDYIIEKMIEKEKAERSLSEKDQNIGSYIANKEKLKKDISRLNQEYHSLLQKVEVTQLNKTKFQKTREYISVLQSFVDSQKRAKKESLEKNILSELKKLLHKLQGEVESSKFISDVSVSILPDNGGMKITLFDSNDNEVKKEILGAGEKQIYISCLIKAILKESVQSLPIFIDTPLGRLDDEHIKNILLYYYPDLSEQVVILSTNNEITPRRFKDIELNVSKTYLLENDGIRTNVKPGYFKSV
ncbi:DNA sulfur modification protein DndD [Flavobacterium sp. KS-LB2]|uniref:DNA sulfur modification protein DndD n=1 Tax=Flavobacterium sp. KS-LB2 TaxID=3120525 RepID=UPI0030CC92BE